MTNKEIFITWGKFLAEEYNCHPDENGNYACDNGGLCNKCITKEVYEKYCKKSVWGLTKAPKYDIISM